MPTCYTYSNFIVKHCIKVHPCDFMLMRMRREGVDQQAISRDCCTQNQQKHKPYLQSTQQHQQQLQLHFTVQSIHIGSCLVDNTQYHQQHDDYTTVHSTSSTTTAQQ